MDDALSKLNDNFLSCNICTEIFKDPCTIGCQHTFCKVCLTRYTKTRREAIRANSIQCPNCRQMTKVPRPQDPVDQWSQQFKPSFLIQGLLDTFTSQGNSDPVEHCCFACQQIGKATKAKSVCEDCDILLCEACATIHQATPVSSGHLVSPLRSGSTPRLKKRKVMCKEHNCQVEFCCKDCQKAVCHKCCIVYHRKCNSVVTLESMIPEMKQVLHQNSDQINSHIQQTGNTLKSRSTHVEEITQHKSSLLSEIKRVSQQAVDLIRRKEKKLLNELDTLTEKQTGQLRSQIKSGEIDLQTYQQYYEFTKQVLQSNSPMDMFDMYTLCQSGEIHAEIQRHAIQEDWSKSVFFENYLDVDILDKSLLLGDLKYVEDKPNLQDTPKPLSTVSTGTTISTPLSTVSAGTTVPTPLCAVSAGTTVLTPFSAISTGTTVSTPLSTVSAGTTVSTPLSAVSAGTTVLTPLSAISTGTTVSTPLSTVSAGTTVSTPLSAVSAGTTVLTPLSTVSAGTTVSTPLSTVSAGTTVSTPLSAVSAGTTVLTPHSAVSTGTTVSTSLSTVSAGTTVSTPLSAVSAGTTVLTPLSAVSTGTTVSTPLSTVSAGTTVSTPLSAVSAGTTVLTSLSAVSTGTTVSTSLSTVSAGTTISTPISTVSTGTTVSTPLSTVSTGTTVPTPISTVSTGTTISTPFSTVITGTRVSTPLSTVSAGTTVSTPLSTVSPGTTVSTPLSTVSTGTTVSTPLSTVSTGTMVSTLHFTISTGTKVSTPLSAVSTGTTISTPLSTVSPGTTVSTPLSTVSSGTTVSTPLSTVSTGTTVSTPLSTVSPGTTVSTPLSTVSTANTVPKPFSTVITGTTVPKLLFTVRTGADDDTDPPIPTDIEFLDICGVDTLVITDIDNKSVKSCYTKHGKPHCTSLKLNEAPFRLTKVGQDRVAVSNYPHNSIGLIKLTPDPVLVSSIKTKKNYECLTSLSDTTLAAGCDDPPSIDVLDLSGKVLRSVITPSTGQQLLQEPWFMCTTRQGHIVVTDDISCSVYCVTQQGEVVYTYKLRGDGVTTTDTGSVIVADWKNNKIVQLTERGEYVRDLLTVQDGIDKPLGIRVQGNKLYVTERRREHIKIFQM